MSRSLLRGTLDLAAGAGEAVVSRLGGLSPSFGQSSVLAERGHRPWPLPDGPWLMAQSWEHLLFAHWRVPAEKLRPLLPPQIPIDTYDGSAWLGVTPFAVTAFRLRGTPHLPGVTAFPEVNVRTYTTIGGKPGIFFLSLDAASAPAVAAARRAYRLPYFHARISLERRDGWLHYRSERTSPDGEDASLAMRYRPTGAPSPAPAGSLAAWLAERYCLYTLDERRTVLRADIHHPPWPLQDAEATWRHNSMAAPYGLEPPPDQALLHFARRQDVVIWPIRRLREGSPR